MLRKILQLVLVCLVFVMGVAHADKPSDSYLSLKVEKDRIHGQWDIALRDLDFAIGLDSDGNGELTWDEVRAKHADIAAYALSRLTLNANGQVCPSKVTEQLIDDHTDGAYAVLRFESQCKESIADLNVQYSLLFDIDPQHKGLLKLETLDQQVTTAVFGKDLPAQSFQLANASKLHQLMAYVDSGIWHIWKGFDHLLFLISLLLPSVLIVQGESVTGVAKFKTSLMEVLKIVSAFTFAHSITLSLATLEIIALPSRLVESVIALSIIVSALNNIFPIVRTRLWLVAFGFGLIHGFGFAGVLGDLGLPKSALALALVGFNVGVEIGQACIVIVFLPLAYALRKTFLYRRLVFVGGSSAIILLATIWLIERAGNLQLISS